MPLKGSSLTSRIRMVNDPIDLELGTIGFDLTGWAKGRTIDPDQETVATRLYGPKPR